jgi:hypothetical protein
MGLEPANRCKSSIVLVIPVASEQPMLGIPLRYLLNHPVIAVAELAADPLEIGTTIHEVYVAQREQRQPQCRYESDDNWEQRLHEALGVPWPCNATAEFWDLWPEVRGNKSTRSKMDSGRPGELSALE